MENNPKYIALPKPEVKSFSGCDINEARGLQIGSGDR